jgi:hypothetical protein
VAEDAMCDALRRASEMRPQRTLLTEGQRRAWKRLAKEFGDDLATLSGSSARDIAEAGLAALQTEALELMKHPAVKEAYDQFLLVSKLVKEKS